MLNLVQKLINKPEVQKLLKKVKEKNKENKKKIKIKTETKKQNSTVTKNNNQKKTSILNQFNLLNKISTTKKKTLLGG